MVSPLARRHSLAAACALALLSLGTPACAKRDAPTASAEVAAAAAPADASKQDGKMPDAAPRKIIKNATLSVETADPRKARQAAIGAVEKAGGYVASSSEYQSSDETTSVSMTLKVPSEKLSETLSALRSLGARVPHENISSQDVSAEFYDLEARLKAQRAIEAQFLEIAKEAKSVPDLLAVQQKLGEVRSEIERMEGRRNQLEHQTSLSTIQLTLQQEASASSLVTTVGRAGHDAKEVFSALTHGSIRAVGVLLPTALFFGPLGYVAFLLFRRLHRRASRA